jgi:hypothetical protein
MSSHRFSVQPVVVVWGGLAAAVEADGIAYVPGEAIGDWLCARPERLGGERCEALQGALRRRCRGT